jgi:hypothetical protein
LAIDRVAGTPDPEHLKRACDLWRAEEHMARVLGTPRWEREAAERLQKYCR